MRRGNVKRNAVIVREYRQTVSADFISYITVGGNAVSADPNRIDLFFAIRLAAIESQISL